jgi:hypothetical protein
MHNLSEPSHSMLPEENNLEEIEKPAENQHSHVHLQQKSVHADAEVTGL